MMACSKLIKGQKVSLEAFNMGDTPVVQAAVFKAARKTLMPDAASDVALNFFVHGDGYEAIRKEAQTIVKICLRDEPPCLGIDDNGTPLIVIDLPFGPDNQSGLVRYQVSLKTLLDDYVNYLTTPAPKPGTAKRILKLLADFSAQVNKVVLSERKPR